MTVVNSGHRARAVASAIAITLSSSAGLWLDTALAQQAGSTAAAQVRFDIPAGPLAQALNRLAGQAGLALTYDPALAAGKTTGALQGEFTPAVALERLLAGTGLDYRFTGTDTVTLSRAVAQGVGVVSVPPDLHKPSHY